jgi:8-oxo-dGTP pyrophosphatase MutT (NUDIX family)
LAQRAILRQGVGVFDRATGDGFIRCSDGHVRWGVYGAAGVLFVVRGEAGDRTGVVSGRDGDDGNGGADRADVHVMMQKRSAMAHEGGTWSCAGGALDRGEMPIDGALREATEEVGAIPGTPRLIGEYIFKPAVDWAYTTVVVEVDERFGSSINFETDAVGWFTPDEVHALPLHAGFAAAWPHLRTIIES